MILTAVSQVAINFVKNRNNRNWVKSPFQKQKNILKKDSSLRVVWGLKLKRQFVLSKVEENVRP